MCVCVRVRACVCVYTRVFYRGPRWIKRRAFCCCNINRCGAPPVDWCRPCMVKVGSSVCVCLCVEAFAVCRSGLVAVRPIYPACIGCPLSRLWDCFPPRRPVFFFFFCSCRVSLNSTELSADYSRLSCTHSRHLSTSEDATGGRLDNSRSSVSLTLNENTWIAPSALGKETLHTATLKRTAIETLQRGCSVNTVSIKGH